MSCYLNLHLKKYFYINLITFIAAMSCLLMPAQLTANEHKTESLTTVYKVVGEDGSITFSDQPNAQSETLLVPPVPTVPAIDPNASTSAPAIGSTDSEIESYTLLSILAPSNDSAFYSASGDVDVIVDVKPALLKEDTLAYYLDNKLITTKRQLQIRIPSVERGSHVLTVKLLSSDGETLKESSSMFTVHKPIVRH